MFPGASPRMFPGTTLRLPQSLASDRTVLYSDFGPFHPMNVGHGAQPSRFYKYLLDKLRGLCIMEDGSFRGLWELTLRGLRDE